jgi:hypothetical protein
MPSLLTDMPDESLWAGDVIRLVDDHDLGPGAGPVDLMLFDPRDGAGLGVVVLSGGKSGLILSVFPGASCGTGKRSLETAWLLRHWDDWFCYTYPRDEAGRPIPLPLEGTLVIRPDEREISIKTDADRRPT